MKIIGLVGFGKLGQAVAAQILDSGIDVIAFDTDPRLSTSFASGEFTSSEPGVLPSLKNGWQENRLTVHSEPSPLSQCKALIVCIPLLAVGSPSGAIEIDYHSFDQCFRSIAKLAHDNMLISLETTVPVGVCRNRVMPIFDSEQKIHGRDYLLAFSPERVQSTTMRSQLVTNPKLVAGITNGAQLAALQLYETFLPPKIVEPVSSVEIAELIKLTAMVSRDVNIAFVNQLSTYCDAANLDIREVLKHVNSDQFTHLLSPGIGVGGHCTPVYPHFLMSNFAELNLAFTLAEEGRRINNSVPEYVVNSVCQEFNVKSTLILGLGFRPNVKEDICSPAYQLNQLLRMKGVQTFLNDPLYTEEELTNKGFISVEDPYSRQFDAIFLVTAHEQFGSLDFQRLAKNGCKILIDGRNAIENESVVKSGLAYRGMGTGYFMPEESRSFQTTGGLH